MAEPPDLKQRRDWWIFIGMAVTAVSAAVSSFSGLRALAEASGWQPMLAPLFPLTVDAYAMTATRVWLAQSTGSQKARRFARWNAIGAILLSLAGNAAWHLIAAHLVPVTWVIVVVVGAVPPAVLGLLSHMAVLRRQADPLPAAEAGATHQDERTVLVPGAAVPSTGDAVLSTNASAEGRPQYRSRAERKVVSAVQGRSGDR